MKKSIYILFAIFTILASCESKEPVSLRFNHVFLQVSNMERSVKFYTEALGLKVTNDSVKHIVVTLEDGTQHERDVNIVFLKFPEQNFVFELGEVTFPDSLNNFALFQHIGIDVKDINKAVQKAKNAGVKVSPILFIQTQGVELKQAQFTGPDGERIELDQIISGEF